MSSVSPIYGGAGAAPPLDRVPTQTLTQDDFLQLLVTQMTTQDPMNPNADMDFFSQMASFSSLEHAKQMQADIAQLRSDQQVLSASSLLGRTVEVSIDESTSAVGVVSAVQIEAGTPKVVVGDVTFDLSEVRVIAPASVG
jgi:flagellar basal-body rod modification protein FlgD